MIVRSFLDQRDGLLDGLGGIQEDRGHVARFMATAVSKCTLQVDHAATHKQPVPLAARKKPCSIS